MSAQVIELFPGKYDQDIFRISEMVFNPRYFVENVRREFNRISNQCGWEASKVNNYEDNAMWRDRQEVVRQLLEVVNNIVSGK